METKSLISVMREEPQLIVVAVMCAVLYLALLTLAPSQAMTPDENLVWSQVVSAYQAFQDFVFAPLPMP